MREVLYTDDLEPITVLELPPALSRLLDQHDRIRLPALDMLSFAKVTADHMPTWRTVAIRAEPLRLRGLTKRLLFTADDESALLLRSVFLPGQQRAVNELKDRARGEGMLEMLHFLWPQQGGGER